MSRARGIAVLGRIPPDVRAALDTDVTLLDADAVTALTAQARGDITHGLTSAMGGVSAAMLARLPGLQKIASVGAGTEMFDLADLSARGITLHPTLDVMTEDTAECAVALTYALLRNVVGNDQFVRSGAWAASRAPLGRRVSERRVGIVGLGRIGSCVARKLSAHGADVSYTARGQKDVPWRFEAEVSALARSVDVLILTCAGGAQTRGLISAEVLEHLGPQGYLVNVSRGSVVDEAALIAALEAGQIAGAALDVFEAEPTPDRRLLDMPTCILSPHAASYTHENRRDLIADIRCLLDLDGPRTEATPH